MAVTEVRRRDRAASVRGNLPAQVSSFVGRRHEIALVKRSLRESRPVTLTGTGGIGKSRLAMQVAGEVRRSFRDGVWLVDFTEASATGALAADGTDPQVLGYVVMTELGVRESGGESPVRQVTRYLRRPANVTTSRTTSSDSPPRHPRRSAAGTRGSQPDPRVIPARHADTVPDDVLGLRSSAMVTVT